MSEIVEILQRIISNKKRSEQTRELAREALKKVLTEMDLNSSKPKKFQAKLVVDSKDNK